MTDRIQKLKEIIREKKHHPARSVSSRFFSNEFMRDGLSDVQRQAHTLIRLLDAETPVIFDEERIVFTRTISRIPFPFTDSEWGDVRKKHYIHELGYVSNVLPDYASLIAEGIIARKETISAAIAAARNRHDDDGVDFLESTLLILDAVLRLAERYEKHAESLGRDDITEIFRRIPKYGAQTFHEALQFFRILHFTLWLSGSYHCAIGRFDQYLYPYYTHDRECGMTEEGALELLEDFFLSFNKDSDLYPGIQQGDNGQSMVLGGVDADGNDAFNDLSSLCLTASLELGCIDPKINLRVHRNTATSVYEKAVELTKAGLGFPQYANDEKVIPGLLEKGYALADACNYAIAACWEFIIPSRGMDVVNIAALSFNRILERLLFTELASSPTYDSFFDAYIREIRNECRNIAASVKNLYMIPAPFLSVMMDGCIERARDISRIGVYNNYGIHGCGIAAAADSLASIKKNVFEEKRFCADELLSALQNDFHGREVILIASRAAPKMGNDDDYVDVIAKEILTAFSDAVKPLRNERGGVFRAGTGTAMFYLRHANSTAMPDGRTKGEPLGTNYSPSLSTLAKGPVSVIHSFAKPDITQTINGGPLTLELHETLFRNADVTKKIAFFIQSYMDLGGHQLQLNAVNAETLHAAQINPENHRNLIVRVWGWSGYFTELDKEYQDHIIARTEYGSEQEFQKKYNKLESNV